MNRHALVKAGWAWCLTAPLWLSCAKPSNSACVAIDETRLVLYEGTELGGPGSVTAGERVRCAASPLGPVFADALSLVPPRLRPELTVHAVDHPPNTVWQGIIEYDSASKSVWVRTSALPGVTRSIALHEIAHVALDGPRPAARPAQRLHRAVNEAVADYFAAQLAASPRLGSDALGELRDLSKPPRITSSEWARLALPQPFPAHHFAHSLASIWWRDAPGDLDYLSDLLATLATPEPFEPSVDTPREVVEALVQRCPMRSRRRFSSSLDAWLPPELVESS